MSFIFHQQVAQNAEQQLLVADVLGHIQQASARALRGRVLKRVLDHFAIRKKCRFIQVNNR